MFLTGGEEMSVLCINGFENHMNWGYRSSLPVERSIPAYALGQRRHAFSSCGPEAEESLPYSSNPRMKRRGAVCYQPSDTTAQYIRFLGKLTISVQVFCAVASQN